MFDMWASIRNISFQLIIFRFFPQTTADNTFEKGNYFLILSLIVLYHWQKLAKLYLTWLILIHWID